MRVTIVVILLYISLGLWITGYVYIIKSYPVSKYFWFQWGCLIANSVVLFFLIYMIGKGKDWARITFFLVLIIGAPDLVLDLWKNMTAESITRIYYIYQFALIIVVFILSFQKESNEWFSKVGTLARQSEAYVTLPKRFKTAIALLYIRLGIYIYLEAVSIFGFLLGVSELNLGFQPKSHIGIFLTTHVWTLLPTIIVRDVVSLYLVYMTGKGKNWARIIILLGCIVDISRFIWHLPQLVTNNPTSLISNLPLLGLTVAALVYLFQRESNEWFKESGRLPQQQSHPEDVI